METMSVMSVIELNPTTKQQANDFASKLILEVNEGNVNPLDLHIKLTAMQTAIETVKKAISEQTLTEAQRYGQKTFEHQSAEVTIKELGTKYDYSNCNDAELEELNKKIASLEEAKKKRETFLKALTSPMDIVVNEAEVVKIYPPVKRSTTGVAITLK